MSGVKSGINNAKIIMLGLLVIGLMGLLFLIVYGNLSGNLGFVDSSGSVNNASVNLTNAGNVPTGLTGLTNPVLTGVIVTNQTGTIVVAGNYTVTGATFSNATTGIPLGNYNNTIVFVNASYTSESQGEQNTEQVIGNLTGGVVSFFSFSNVWFILGAVALLIAIVVGIIVAVTKLGGGGRSKFSN